MNPIGAQNISRVASFLYAGWMKLVWMVRLPRIYTLDRSYLYKCRQFFRSFEADRNMAHSGKVVDFVGLYLLDDPNQIG